MLAQQTEVVNMLNIPAKHHVNAVPKYRLTQLIIY